MRVRCHNPLARQRPCRCASRTNWSLLWTLPTTAGRWGAGLVPEDRPIDGVDASAFMLGKGNATGRDSYMFFGVDGELMSIKWKIYKTIFRYTENTVYPAIQSGFITPQFPMIYDLSSDPHEDNNLFYTNLTQRLDPCAEFQAHR